MTEIALYLTVWIAVALFTAGELSKDGAHRHGWPASAAGAALLAAHIVLALHTRHEWSQASVARAVDEQARRVYGTSWSGAFWANYAFFAVWAGELAWWGTAPRRYFTRSRLFTLAIRSFFLVILVNAAIIFAAPSRRLVGLVVIALLGWAWRDTFGSVAGARGPALQPRPGP